MEYNLFIITELLLQIGFDYWLLFQQNALESHRLYSYNIHKYENKLVSFNKDIL